jgi:hypothetical protein
MPQHRGNSMRRLHRWIEGMPLVLMVMSAHPHRANECFAAMHHPGTEFAYVGTTERWGTGVFQLVFRASDGALVYVAIKFVPKGRAPEDECFVRTIPPTSESEVRRQMTRGELERIYPDATPLGDLRPPP